MENKLAVTIVNCFCTESELSGNPAGVVVDYQGNDSEKLAIAVKLNLPVVVFVSDANSEIPLVEYFYPYLKMPLCLHGTLAAAEVLLSTRQDRAIQLRTEENKILKIVRAVPDYLQIMVSSQRTQQVEVTTDIVISMLNIQKNDIAPNLPTTVVSVGSPKLLIPITASHSLATLQPDFSLIKKWSIENNVNGIYVYAQDSQTNTFNARGFNPKAGHNEDAATGVAAAALSLAVERSIVVYQGISLNTSCSIIVNFENRNHVWVGGKEKIIAQQTLSD